MAYVPFQALLDEDDEAGDKEEYEGEVDEEGRDRRLGAILFGVGPQKSSVSNLKHKQEGIYREVYLDLTPEIEVLHMMFER